MVIKKCHSPLTCLLPFLKSILGISYLNICICVETLYPSAKLRSFRASFCHFQRNSRLSTFYDHDLSYLIPDTRLLNHRPSYVRAIVQNRFTISLQKKNRSDILFLQNFTKWRRIKFLSSSHFTHKSSASLLAFHLNTDTPLACIHFFSSNTLLIYLVTPHTLCFRSFSTTLKQLWIIFFYLIGIS